MQLRCVAMTEREFDTLQQLLTEVLAESYFAIESGASTGKLRGRVRDVPMLLTALGKHWIQNVEVEGL